MLAFSASTLEEDDIRFPIGFSVDGRLSKILNPTSSDKASIASCENWAGVGCKQDESLKANRLQKRDCGEKGHLRSQLQNWLDGGTSPYNYVRWDPNAETGCPSIRKTALNLTNPTLALTRLRSV